MADPAFANQGHPLPSSTPAGSAATVGNASAYLGVSDAPKWPEEWKDSKTGENLNKFLDDVHRMSYHQVNMDKRKLMPRQYPNPQAAKSSYYNDNYHTVYIAMTRESLGTHPGKAKLRKPMETITVPEAEYAPSPALDIANRYQDSRIVDRPVDILSYDEPAADTMRYLERGNTFASTAMTEGKWLPGQLIGENGADPAKIADSPSFISPDRWNEVSDRRSVTSAGFVLQCSRPLGVCLGWGGYDELTAWQSHGRRIKKDMVEERSWSTDIMVPVAVVNEAGEDVEIISMPFKREDLVSLPLPRTPISIHDRLNQKNDRKMKASATTNDN
ncbi:hypothetical protein QIS74_03832 [Colletotrichum tabaci]|uniref:Uncharacterized protein n=1 Tax=Colletotrichum tabaci TaxID=1209068 RepID=A0AAV9TLH0_9PEZI